MQSQDIIPLPENQHEFPYFPKPTIWNFQDLTGQRFMRLEVKAYAGGGRWFCICNCGHIVKARAGDLKRGDTKSCGCLKKEISARIRTTHGYGSRINIKSEYGIWNQMHQRCKNPKHRYYSNYGGRGIRVCERWQKFENFLADIGPRPSLNHSLDRIDGNKGYEPGNVKWATKTEQARNQRNNRIAEYQGKTMTLAEACEIAKKPYSTVKARIDRHEWPIEKALSVPVKSNRQ